MTSHDPSPNVAASDRRSSSREESLEHVRVTVESQSLEGTLQNSSDGGMLVVLDDCLIVEITTKSGGSGEPVSARLRRGASLPGQRCSWGLEIIGDSSAA